MSRMLWMLRKLWLCAALAVLVLAAAPAGAENWVNIPGRVVFDADNGQVQTLYFSSWATNKETFVPAARGYDVRLAGFFSFVNGNEHTIMHVTDAASFTLQGDLNPVIITMPDKRTMEVNVVNSFIWAIARMKEFRFVTLDPEFGVDVVYVAPSESVRRLFFYPE